jgi:hypothetical protein
MAFTAPTPDDLKTAFPAFNDVEDAAVTYWLTRAARVVDSGWGDDDGPHATILLAAHYLTLQGLGTGAEAEAAAAGASGFKRIKSGSLEMERADGGSGEYDTTAYGRQFQSLLRTVRGGPRVTGTGTLPYDAFGRLPGW